MKGNLSLLLASAVIVAGIGVGPASAGGLLGGLGDTVNNVVNNVVDTVGDVVDGSDGQGTNVGGLVSLNDSGNDALINVDVGGDRPGNNNLLNAAVGKGSDPLVNANVSSTGLLSSTSVAVDVGGLGLDLDLDLGILDPSNPNGPGNPGGNPNNPVLVGSIGGGAGGTFVIACTVNNSRQVLQVAAAGKITASEIKAWQRSANVQIVPIKLCPQARKQVAAIFAKSKKVNLLHRAVMSDALITASLNRTRYDAKDVVAVQRKGGQLVVYVF